MSIGELLALEPGAAERFFEQRLGYTESAGSPALRQAIAALYASTGPEQILVHSGAEEAIFLFMQAALEPGDHLVVQTPCYQSLVEVARSIGCMVDPWPLREEEGWAPDLDELRRLIRRRTRAVVVNSPHNPTGYQMPLAMFREVIRTGGRAGHPAVLRRGVPGSGIPGGGPAARGLRPERGLRVPGRDVQELRAGRAAHRLAGHAQRPPSGRGGRAQGLHHHLQPGAQRVPGRAGPAVPASDPPPQPGPHRRQPAGAG